MAKFTVMRFIGDHGILRHSVTNSIYGTADAGSEIKLTVSREKKIYSEVTAVSGSDGEWKLELPPFEASFDSYKFEFSCGSEMIRYSDILFGELFHISGQSNMELPLCRTIDRFDPHYPEENTFIREFRVPVESCFGEDEEYNDFCGGSWEKATGDVLMQMSAAGHYFAWEIFRKYKVPVGLVNTSAGGAPVEGRMPCRMLREIGGYDEFLDKVTKPNYIENTTHEDEQNMRLWTEDIDSRDTVSAGIFEREDGFTECDMPFHFRNDERLKGFCGRIWFRKKFVIPDNMPLDDALISLGAMIDADIIYINGVKVGETGYMYPPRIYDIPGGVLHSGENTVFVRLEVHGGQGGFVEEKRYCLKLGENIIELGGKWEYIIAADAPALRPGVFFQGLPLAMYAKLTAPAFRISFSGLIWYQAESNGDFERYPMLFGKFVEMYRSRSGYDIPVIFAQLPNFSDPLGRMVPASWAQLREAQRKCLAIPGTAMAVTIDTGESYDLHPLNKWDVGKRLAYCAERIIYNDTTAPAYIEPVSAAYTDDGKIVVSFTDNSAVTSKYDTLGAFEVAFEDGTAAKATGRLTANGAELSVSSSSKPRAVRYLWDNDPKEIDLYTGDVPVTPFEIAL